MFKALLDIIVRWFKQQFNGNPLVTEPRVYLPKVKQAYKVWLLAIACCLVLPIIATALFVVSVLNGWV